MSIEVLANILDPIHDALPASVWSDPGSDQPKLKVQHRKWIQRLLHQTLTDAGYSDIDEWLSLVLTGSLTTYQYSDQSDCDVSVWVDSEHFPEWSRAEMIGLMISKVDGTILPGTSYPMQCFVVARGMRKEDLYSPSLRSGYDLTADAWVTPPDRDRVHDVKAEQYGVYAYALEQADKMETLLKYEPDKAVEMWHMIHKKRMRDQRNGHGDFALSNIIYKFLANRGLFKDISEASGEYIAKVAFATRCPRCGLVGMNDEGHCEDCGYTIPYDGGEALEGHEDPNAWAAEQPWTIKPFHPVELGYGPRRFGQEHTALVPHQVAKFVYDPITNRLFMGQMGKEEGENVTHYQLMKGADIDPKDEPLFGQVHANGYAETFGRPQLTGYGQGNGKPSMNPYEAEWRMERALKLALPGVKFTNPANVSNPRWEEHWTEPSIQYFGERPTLDATDELNEPTKDYAWTF